MMPWIPFGKSHRVLASNKQLERTVIRQHVRAAGASLHCAHAPPLKCGGDKRSFCLDF
jgi:hypothetical protein